MDMACRFAQTSHAERLKVGSLIVKNDSIISLGVNGMPPKWPTEVCEDKIHVRDEVSRMHSRIPDGICDIVQWMKVEYPYMDTGGMYRLKTKPECRHSEEASLEKLWNSPETARGASMFISHSPCPKCSRKIATAGIIDVYYREEFRDLSGLGYLRSMGIKVEQVKSEN